MHGPFFMEIYEMTDYTIKATMEIELYILVAAENEEEAINKAHRIHPPDCWDHMQDCYRDDEGAEIFRELPSPRSPTSWAITGTQSPEPQAS